MSYQRNNETVWIDEEGTICCIFCHVPMSAHERCRRCTAFIHERGIAYDKSLFENAEPAYISRDPILCEGCVNMDMTGREPIIRDEDGPDIFRRSIIERESVNDISSLYKVSVASIIDTIRREACKMGLIDKSDKREIKVIATRKLYAAKVAHAPYKQISGRSR